MRRSLFGIYQPLHKTCLFIADIASIAASFTIANLVRLKTTPDFSSIEYVCLNIIIVFSLFVGNAYSSRSLTNLPKLPLNTFFVVLASAVPSTILIYSFGPERFAHLFGRGVFPVAIILLGVLSIYVRVFFNILFRVQDKDRLLLVLGDKNSKANLESKFSNQSIHYRVVTQKSIVKPFERESLYAIIISPEYHPTPNEQQFLISSRLNGVAIYSLAELFESLLFLVPVNEINNDWFIRSQGFTMLHSSVAVRIKRAVDIVGATFLLISTLPITIPVAILTKFVSNGPIFFSQTRTGMKGENFTIYKFRTMHIGAEKSGAQWASEDDQRIIPLGSFFRRTRIDELPQCWNILKGEMSIVGPRPERPEFTSSLSEEIPYYDLRHVVKPGLTGWAQVSYPYGASTEDALRKLQYDLYYIKNYSLLLDLNILLRTILVTLRRGGR